MDEKENNVSKTNSKNIQSFVAKLTILCFGTYIYVYGNDPNIGVYVIIIGLLLFIFDT